MISPFLLALLTFLALLPVLAPLLRGVAAVEEDGTRARAVYRDQLREVDRDRERGVLTEAEATSARLEIQRRLLAMAPDIPAAEEKAETVSRPRRRSRFLAALAGLGMAGGSLGLYFILGEPLPPGAEQANAPPIVRLAAHLHAHPDDAQGWTLYARAMTAASRWPDAEAAWRRVLALGRTSPDAVAALGETLVMRDNGAISAEARAFFEMALSGDPKHQMARYYMALATANDGDVPGAVSQWRALLADMTPDSPGRAEVARRIEEASSETATPPAPDQQKAMIAGMVEKLAARLRDTPDEAEGWARLGRAYAVLGRTGVSVEAYEKAVALKPEDAGLKRDTALALMTGLGPEDAIPSRARDFLRQAEAGLPNDPAVLWYLGLDAARDLRTEEARGYWTRLAALLPAETGDGKMVREALAALPPARTPPR